MPEPAPIAIPPGIGNSYRAAAAELGFASAAWLLVAQAAAHGDAAVEQVRDLLGREYPVLDAVAAAWLGGARPSVPDCAAVREVLGGCRRVVIVGLEQEAIDALVDGLPGLRLGLLTYATLPADWERIVGNCRGRVEALDLDAVQHWAGSDSGVLVLSYGPPHGGIFTTPAWLRLQGPDLRIQFRVLAAWNIMPLPFAVYPRWLAAADREWFTAVLE